jgi:hypothetical protein
VVEMNPENPPTSVWCPEIPAKAVILARGGNMKNPFRKSEGVRVNNPPGAKLTLPYVESSKMLN